MSGNLKKINRFSNLLKSRKTLRRKKRKQKKSTKLPATCRLPFTIMCMIYVAKTTITTLLLNPFFCRQGFFYNRTIIKQRISEVEEENERSSDDRTVRHRSSENEYDSPRRHREQSEELSYDDNNTIITYSSVESETEV